MARRTERRTYQMAFIGLMTAVICVLAPFSVLLPFSPIPVSLGTFGIYLACLVLGMKRGTTCVAIYILLGMVGLPVFTGFTGGIGKLLGPTGGYIIGYVFLSILLGFFVDRWGNRLLPCFVGMILSTGVCYCFGTVWLAYQSQISMEAALTAAVLPFLPGDLVKMGVACMAGREIRRRMAKAGMNLPNNT